MFHKSFVSKKLMDKTRGDGQSITIFFQKFLSHSAENFHTEPFSVSLNSVLGKFFLPKKVKS